jgi:2-keto-4-pentenoate hydratase
VVLTGTTTGVVPLRTGETAIAEFGSLGRIELSLHGAPHPNHVAAAI